MVARMTSTQSPSRLVPNKIMRTTKRDPYHYNEWKVTRENPDSGLRVEHLISFMHQRYKNGNQLVIVRADGNDGTRAYAAIESGKKGQVHRIGMFGEGITRPGDSLKLERLDAEFYQGPALYDMHSALLKEPHNVGHQLLGKRPNADETGIVRRGAFGSAVVTTFQPYSEKGFREIFSLTQQLVKNGRGYAPDRVYDTLNGMVNVMSTTLGPPVGWKAR